MNTDDILEEGRRAFVVECGDLLREMEDRLLRLESDAGDAESINALFRAAHTIKGSAGLFAFDDIVAFTHVVESVLDRLRNGEVTFDSELAALLLPSCDHIGALIEQAGRTLDADSAAAGAALLARLARHTGTGAPAPAPATIESPGVAAAATGESVASDAWHISVRFGPDVLRNGMDPLSFIQYLGTLGQVTGIATITDALPTADTFDPESCYLGFEITLKSNADKRAIEDVFEFVRDDCRLTILPPHSRLAAYTELMEQLPEGRERLGDILVACGALTDRELALALGTQQASADAPRLGEVLVGAGNVQPEVVEAALQRQQRARTQRGEESRSIRVDADKLDRLINLVGELIIAGAGTDLRARRCGDAALIESTTQLTQLTEEIRDEALRLRMVQIGETFNRFHRVVRDISCELSKDIGLEISGADTELDKSVVEKIGDPLMHLVRNAMDHGLESADERIAAGKPPRGTIALNAFHDSGSIVIEVSDDGRGLNRERILAKARERGLVRADQVLSEFEIDHLIFAPGFSTAQQVTSLSGRGVGMDVVKSNIESLRGSVAVSSTAGRGTTVSIRLPLTLAIIDGFLVQVGGSTYVIPLDMIVECVELPRESAGTGSYLSLRGSVLPYMRLRQMFDLHGAPGSRESVVVVRSGGRNAGIVVDKLLGEAQTVIKPLGRIFSDLKGIAGSSILGTGDVALILDVAALVEKAQFRHGGSGAPARPAAESAVAPLQ